MKTFSKFLKGGAALMALMSLTFCQKDNSGGESGGGNEPVVLNQRANCFVVKPGTAFQFPPCMGNSKNNVEATSAGLVWQDNASLVSSVAVENGNISVKLNAGQEGNAVVCALNEAKDTTWSWTLWVLNDAIQDVTVSNSAGSATFMDRNIGALSANDLFGKAIGNFYQWGRKDAFPSQEFNTLDSVDKKIYNLAGQEIKVRYFKMTEPSLNNIPVAIAHPLTSYWQAKQAGVTDGNYGWISTMWNSEEAAAIGIDTLWNNNSKKTIYDPCPAGYRVGDAAAWAVVTGFQANPADTTTVTDKAYTPDASITSTWDERYYTQYQYQAYFRGARYGNLFLYAGGDKTHQGVGEGLVPKAKASSICIWTAKADNLSTVNNFRAFAAKATPSFVKATETEPPYVKVGALNTSSGLNFGYNCPVRCIKEVLE